MKLKVPLLDRIWRVKGALAFEEPLSAQEVFERLNPLFEFEGTQACKVAIDGPTLTYEKTNPAAQDKLATFTSGTLRLDNDQAASRLSYEVASTALFFCFIAPLFFLAFAQLANALNTIEKPAVEAQIAEEKKQEAAKEPAQLHWIDQALGAPAPKQPGDEDDTDSREEVQGNHSPRVSYVLAGVFFAIYLAGRMLEPYLLKRTFKALLVGSKTTKADLNNHKMEAGTHLAPSGKGSEIS